MKSLNAPSDHTLAQRLTTATMVVGIGAAFLLASIGPADAATPCEARATTWRDAAGSVTVLSRCDSRAEQIVMPAAEAPAPAAGERWLFVSDMRAATLETERADAFEAALRTYPGLSAAARAAMVQQLREQGVAVQRLEAAR